MKEGIHPAYGPATIHCACGSILETRSTVQGIIQVDICSSCHPFFTGKQKFIDTAGRIDRFTKKFGSRIAHTQKRVKPEPAPKKKEKEKPAEAGKPAQGAAAAAPKPEEKKAE